MNSSNANSEPSRFPYSNEITSDIGLNEPGLGSERPAFGSASGRPKPRMMKLRRHAASNHPRSTLPPKTGKIDSGFNRFPPISDNSIPSFPLAEIDSSASGNLNFGNAGNEAFVFGSSREKLSTDLNSNTRISSGFVANKVLDDMRKLKIRSEQEFPSTNSPVLNLNDGDREISSCEGGIEESASFTTRKIDSGFNPFRPILDNSIPSFPRTEIGSSASGNLNFGNAGNEAFVFGTSWEKSSTILNSNTRISSGFVANKVLDDMRKLKIRSEQEFASTNSPVLNLNDTDREISSREGGIDESASSKLPEEIRKLNIKDSGNVESSKNVRDVNSNLSGLNKTHFIFGSARRVAHSFGTSLPSELPNELEKLNIKDVGEVDRGSLNYSSDNMKKFVFADVSKDSTSLAGSSESILPAKMKNLNLDSANNYSSEKKEVNFSARNKSDFVFRSNRGDSGNLDGRGESMLSDEMVKLRMARQAGLSTSQGQTGFGSSTLFVKEKLGNLGDEKFPDAWNSIPYGRYNDYAELHGTTASSTFSSSGVHFQPVGNIIEVPSVERPEKKDGFSFTNSWNGLGMSHVEFTTPNQRGNIFTGLDKKLEFNAKMESATGARSKKKREKLKKSTSAQKWVGQEFVSRSSSQEHPDSFESYSPMEVSPYQETLADNKGSRETSVTSEEAFHLHIDNASSYSHPTVPTDATEEDLVVATQRLNIDEGEMKSAETNVEGSEYRFGKSVGAEAPSEESVWGDETESFISAAEQLDYNFDTFVTAPDTEVSSSLRFEKDSDGSTQFSCASALASASASEASSSSRIERQDSDGSTQFSFASALECVGGTSFAFAASSSAQRQLATAVRHRKKKNRAKVFHESYSSTSKTKVPHTSSSIQFFPPSDTPSLLSPRRGQKGDPPTLFSKKGDKSEAAKEQETKQSSTPDATIAAQEACEKWRLRGNQAYTNGDMSKAEDYYTQGVNCVSQNENSTGCLRALMLCYSNRAATRMSLGRMREALADCMKAAAIDPSFLRVQVRAANCYLALGEVEDASLHFIKCLQSGSEACMDQKLVLEASEGLEKTQKVSECMKQSTELLQRRTSSGAESALGVIAQALTISSYSEELLEMKADALFMLRKYEELIQLCERTLGSAEMNCPATTADGHLTTLDCSDVQKNPSFRLWRWHLIIKSYFSLGRLEEALDFLKKREGPVSTTEKSEGKSLESLIPLAGTIQELERRKAAGNEAFQSGRHAEAVEHYTAALSCTVESRPFAAVCFCNRAAAFKAMGQIVDAIADCSLAMALDGNYLKAISRRATLFEMIRDYEQATMDLHRLISLLMKQVDDKTNQSGASDRISSMNELRQAQQRLSAIEEEARKEISLNMYLILRVDPSVSVSEIKKAYRKAALRHHPDKACQSLARSENGDDGMWKEVVEEVHKDADRLFKMIGEAYAVLSDPTKRSRYDLEEDMRNTQKRGNGGSGTPKMHTDVQSYPFESNSRRQWQEIWRSYGNSQSRASETTRSSRYS